MAAAAGIKRTRAFRAFTSTCEDTRGAILPMMAAGLFVMILAVGSAIDLARIHIATSQMQSGVDAAALAGANAFDNDSDTAANGRRQQIINYYKDNFPNGYMATTVPAAGTPVGGTTTLLEPTFELVNGISRTTVQAAGTLPMTFMSLVGMEAQQIRAVAKAEFQPHPLEVMVVLDNTGSMDELVNGVMKITALKAAMKSFINVLWQGGNNDQPMLALGIMNYTNVVNVGSILTDAAIPVENMPGFTDQTVPWSLSNGLAWKGCVVNDDTVTNMSTNLATREGDAFDIWNTLPGETPPGSTKVMRAIRPHFSPPAWLSANAGADKTLPGSAFYTQTGDVNLFPKGNAAFDTLQTLANTVTYKRHFYRYYIGLNNGTADLNGDGKADNEDDVIIQPGGGYYDPAAANPFDWKTGTGRMFEVRVSKLPNLNKYKDATAYKNTSNNTPVPSPNWQCPEPPLPIKYKVSRSVYDDFIDKKVWAIRPASGTVHHSGMIWGWRFLSRYTKFPRTPPAGSGTPVRALVFMTDGETSVPGDNIDRRYHYYGTVAERNIIPAGTTDGEATGKTSAASDLRFKKICAIANSTTFADSSKRPKIFVVAINKAGDIDSTAQTMLKNCGTAGYWLTTSSSELSNAFTQIGRTLIDVHLTQ